MNAIVLMAIGDRYTKILKAVRTMFAEYAAFCNADLVVCDAPPDPGLTRNILCQKMLLPSLYRQYEWLAYFDIDILISQHAPSIFDAADDGGAFSAVVDPRGSFKFENVVRRFWKQPAILAETHESYFSDRGFPSHSFPMVSINGGVWLCQPQRIQELFHAMYFSDIGPMVHEEAMMAYVAQRAGLFFELEDKWNTQLIYEMFTPVDSAVVREVESARFRAFQRRAAHSFPRPETYPPAYEALINRTLTNCYCLHFSAGFPFINLKSDLTFNPHKWPASVTEGGLVHDAIQDISSLLGSAHGRLRRLVRRP